jgi:hypothetical protein
MIDLRERCRRLVRVSGGGSHAGQRHLTPLLGRDEEIAMLMRRWERARQGDGQLVLIVGEPGIGKSRLPGSPTTANHGRARWRQQVLKNAWGRLYFGATRFENRLEVRGNRTGRDGS